MAKTKCCWTWSLVPGAGAMQPTGWCSSGLPWIHRVPGSRRAVGPGAGQMHAGTWKGPALVVPGAVPDRSSRFAVWRGRGSRDGGADQLGGCKAWPRPMQGGAWAGAWRCAALLCRRWRGATSSRFAAWTMIAERRDRAVEWLPGLVLGRCTEGHWQENVSTQSGRTGGGVGLHLHGSQPGRGERHKGAERLDGSRTWRWAYARRCTEVELCLPGSRLDQGERGEGAVQLEGCRVRGCARAGLWQCTTPVVGRRWTTSSRFSAYPGRASTAGCLGRRAGVARGAAAGHQRPGVALAQPAHDWDGWFGRADRKFCPGLFPTRHCRSV